MFQLNKNYILVTVIIVLVEIFIAVFVNDTFFRPYFGDFLASILVFTFLKSFLRINISQAALFGLLFSYFIEFLQLIDFLHISGLENFRLIRIVLGSSFSWFDMLAYTLGIVFVLFLEYYFQSKSYSKLT
jgi:hypothetical protein